MSRDPPAAGLDPRLEEFLRGARSGTTRPVPHTGGAASRPLALRVLSDSREVALGRGLTVGRGQANDVVIDDTAVSQRHCILLIEPRGPVIYDCSSTNGTFLNWVRIERADLTEGALIVIGNTHLRVMPAHPSPATDPGAALLGIIGQSAALRAALADVKRAARSRLSVLIVGESGTGKELVARAVHALSPRASGPFVAVNCAAIPREMAESELFGHERGAFTGAIGNRPGVFEEASGGTLFLDEVGDLPTSLQPKLLRVLESRVVRRVGGRAELPVDVRIVAATNRDLGAGDFRGDLYHRLDGVTVRLPALRERADDIPRLVEHFLREVAPEQGMRVLAPGVLDALRAYDWPGNVRELKNAVERAAVLGGPVLSSLDLLRRTAPRPAATASDPLGAAQKLHQIERDAIRAALRHTRGNQRAAALLLGVPRTTLADRARRYGLLDKED